MKSRKRKKTTLKKKWVDPDFEVNFSGRDKLFLSTARCASGFGQGQFSQGGGPGGGHGGAGDDTLGDQA